MMANEIEGAMASVADHLIMLDRLSDAVKPRAFVQSALSGVPYVLNREANARVPVGITRSGPMKPSILIALVAVAVAPGLAMAQSTDNAIKENPGYESGSSDSGKTGMSSSRGVPTSPTAGRLGTVDNGNPSAGTNTRPHTAN